MDEISDIPESAERQLALIAEIAEKSRIHFADNGAGSIIWGLLIVAACVAQSFLPGAAASWWIWGSTYSVGIVATIALFRRYRGRGATHVGESAIRAVWIGAIAAIVFMVAIGATGSVDPSCLPVVVFVVVGLAYWVSGAILRWKAMQALAPFWLVAAAALAFAPPSWVSPVSAVSVFALEVVPGFLMWRASRSRKSK